MATASRRLTRKQIRQPDKFIVLTQNISALIQEHKVKVLLTAGILLAVLLAILAWQFYVNRQNRFAAEEFNRALALYRAGNYAAALPAFQKIEGYSASRFYSLALLYQANSHYALKDTDKAIELGRNLLRSGSPDPLVREAGLMALAAAEEHKGLCKEAIQHYGEAEKLAGPLSGPAALGKARCSAQTGDLKAAIATYREYLRQPDRELSAYVSAQIAELEAKVAAQPSSGK
jgi:tetratricopeptide (TPR) repeat protein